MADRGRGRGRGRGQGRGRGVDRGGELRASPPTSGAPQRSAVSIPSSARFGCPIRRADGNLGVPVDIIVNCFRADVPTGWIHHYNKILPADKILPPRVTTTIIHRMQAQYPTIFTKRGPYDGRKTLYSPIEYPLGGREQFEVNEPDRQNPWVVRIKWVARIKPDSAARYIEIKMSHDNDIFTTFNASNVIIRMQPTQRIPFNSQSFFTRDQPRDIGRGRELWRCFFLPVRPVIGKMYNVDISSAAFYQPGPLVKLHLEYLGASPEVDLARFLSANNIDARTRRDLVKFLRNLNVITPDKADAKPKSIKNFSEEEANNVLFEANDTTTSVAVKNVSEEEANNVLFEANDPTTSVAGDSIWNPFLELLGEALARFLPIEWRARFLRAIRLSPSLKAL